MAKIAVKMSIMRVVKFMSSPANDFTSWQKCQQLLFGGQSGDLPLSLHWFLWLPPGGARDFQCQKFVVKIQKLLMFGELWQPLVSKVTWIRSPMQVRSWDPGVLCCHALPRCCPANTVRDGQGCLVCGCMTPINPYLGGNAWKNGPSFNCQSIYAHFGITSLELNMAPGVLLEPYMSQGGQGVAETPIVSKGLSICILSIELSWYFSFLWK